MSNTSFIIAVQNSHGGWNKAGMVKRAIRSVPDADFIKMFPKGTKSYNEVLKACKWIDQESATSVDLTVRGTTIVRVHKI